MERVKAGSGRIARRSQPKSAVYELYMRILTGLAREAEFNAA